MSWRENRRKKREEPETASPTLKPQHDAEYLSLIDSYHSTRKELRLTACSLLDARHLHDSERKKKFKHQLQKVKKDYAQIKDALGLDGPAELIVEYNDSGISHVTGTTRDWTVANYHLTTKVHKGAKDSGLPLDLEGRIRDVQHYNKRKYEFYNEKTRITFVDPATPPKSHDSFVVKIPVILLRDAGVFIAWPPIYRHEQTNSSPTKAYLDLRDFGKERYTSLSHEDDGRGISEGSGVYQQLDRPQAIKLVGKFMDNPAYKNKIRITAKRIDG